MVPVRQFTVSEALIRSECIRRIAFSQYLWYNKRIIRKELYYDQKKIILSNA